VYHEGCPYLSDFVTHTNGMHMFSIIVLEWDVRISQDLSRSAAGELSTYLRPWEH